MTDPRPILVLTHVDWEQPHRIGDACETAGLTLITCRPLAGDRLPPPSELSGAIVMGGPMNVDDTARHPALANELRWTERCLAADLPMLGVCLGAQLLARALGATVYRGSAPEIGWAPIDVDGPNDPLLGNLSPACEVLHWHGDVFGVPPASSGLAHSELAPCQAFRHRNAWGVLFHLEADAALVEHWLAQPQMAAEARAALGPDAPARLRAGSASHAARLVERSEAGLAAFADLVRSG